MTHSKERPLQIETVAEVGGEVLSNASNTVDDSFKKYYKEQLKDAQSKVLRETSFKRKDLQLSWPHRIKEQRPEPRPTVMHHFSASQDSETSTETLTPSVTSEEMETGSIKNMVLVKEERDEEGQRENGRPPKVAQPQVARIGGRKRLTQEQKKMCFSEPEKLHQLGDSPNHSACRSLGNELEFFITTEGHGEDQGQHDGEQGFVASRRKMFEMRSRTLSASSLSKTNLKNLQHKALVEYMERKTGHKVAEPQQPGPQAHGPEDDSSPANAMETQSSEQASVGEQRVRVVAQRGKSMEELGTVRCSRPPVLSKSSEQLDQLWNPPERAGRDRRKPSGSDSGRWDETAHLRGVEQARQGLETLGLEKTHRRTASKAGSTSQLGADEETRPAVNADARDSSRSTSPASSNSSRVRIPSGTPSSKGSVRDEARLSVPGSESPDLQSPSGPQTRERDVKSTSASPSLISQARSPKESKPEARDRKSTIGTASEQERPLDDPRSVTPAPDFNQEVFTSGQVTMEPELPPPPLPFADVKDGILGFPLIDDVFEQVSNSPGQSTMPLQPPSNCVSETEPADAEEHAEATNLVDPEQSLEPEQQQQQQQQEDKKKEEVEERGAPEGETENAEEPARKPRWVELAVAVAKADRSLVSVLYPLANRKTALMLMEQLLSEDTLLMEEHYKKKQEQAGPADSGDVQPLSAPDEDDHTAACSDPLVRADITEKKRVLVSYAEERLRGLEDARGALQTEVQENAGRGEAVLALVRQHCLPLEVERYGLFIGDLERVVSLLLCLSARLARVQNALSTVDQHTDEEEKESLDSRHRLLCKQREDAKDLKDNLDRRESVVSGFLGRHLSAGQLADYRRYVQTAASLLIRQKDLEERRQLAEEQAEALRCSLP
ncbi:hypothetical protein CRUP_014338 [Coryphaenoides rupestris]|nr:hypothetical protein CRUP_014338 [Coryphaenoides rupestris]